MKRKYWIVEHVEYYGDDNGNPLKELDDRTFRRRSFHTKKDAQQYIDRILSDDPAYLKLWLAKITLHKVEEAIETIDF